MSRSRPAVVEALGFLTVVGGAGAPTPRALPWFGAVGAGVGAAVGLVWWAASAWVALPVAAGLAVLADVVLTGMLHLDGLSDCADALLPPLDRERRLDVLRDPRAGAFGVVAVVSTLLLRFAALYSLTADPRTVIALAAVWSTARTAMAVAAATVPYARTYGLATAFLGASWRMVLLGGAPLALVLGALATVPASRGVLAVAATAAAAAAVVALARRRLGGFTGDVLGAAGVVGETVGLIVLTVRP